MDTLKLFLKKLKNFYIAVIFIASSITYLYFDYQAVKKLPYDQKLAVFLVLIVIGLFIGAGLVALLQWFVKKWKEAKREVINKKESHPIISTKPSKGVSRYQLAVEQERNTKQNE